MKNLLLVSSVLALSACSTAQKTNIVTQINQELDKHPSAVGVNAVEVTGELEVIYFDDFENNRSKRRYFVYDKHRGKRFQLNFEGQPPKNATTGSFVRARGKASSNNKILIEDNVNNSIEIMAAAASITGTEDHNTLVLVTNFNDAAVSCSRQDIEDTVFTSLNNQSVNDLYREMSLNKIQLTGMVPAPFTIDYSSTDTCDVYAWANAADKQAEASGIDLTQYAHKIYVLPKQNGCGGYGVGTIGGSPSKTWIMQCDIKDVYAHELGHNLGMGHSGDTTGQYMDASDIMGLSGIGLRQLNGPHQEQMNWRDPQQIIEITAGGTYDAAPLELGINDVSSAQLFKIRKPDTGEWYYLSYRQPIGFDASLPTSYLTGLSIHQHEGNGSTVKTTWLNTLTDGESFSDSLNGLTITQNYHDEYNVSFQVTLSNKCTRNNPTINLTPSSQTDVAGSTLSYDVNITNNDTVNCSESNWAVATQIPFNWSEALTSKGITVAPSSSQSVNWQVTSIGSAVDNNYTLTVDLVDANTITHDKTIAANYTVTTPKDTQSPTTPTGLTTAVQRKKIVVSWQASTDNIAVAGYKVFRNNILINTTASTTYSDTSLTSGATYAYYAVAFDAANNLSLPSNSSSVTYGKGGGDTKGGGTKGGGKKR